MREQKLEKDQKLLEQKQQLQQQQLQAQAELQQQQQLQQLQQQTQQLDQPRAAAKQLPQPGKQRYVDPVLEGIGSDPMDRPRSPAYARSQLGQTGPAAVGQSGAGSRVELPVTSVTKCRMAKGISNSLPATPSKKGICSTCTEEKLYLKPGNF